MSKIETMLNEATRHHRAGHLPEAERLYRAILAMQPNHPGTCHNFGIMALQAGRPDAALPLLEIAWRDAPAVVQHWQSLIECLLVLRHTVEAGQMIDEASRRRIKIPNTQNLLARIKAQEQAGQLPFFSEIQELNALFSAGRYADVERRANAMLAQHPDFGFGWKVLGAALQMQGKNSLPALQKAVALLPEDAYAHYNLANSLQGINQREAAVQSYRRALELNADFAEAYNNLGNALYELGRFEESAQSCKRALELAPALAEAHNNLANALKGLGRMDEAERSVRHALELKADFPAAHNTLGAILNTQGRQAEAAHHFRRALVLKPDYHEALLNLGVTMGELGRPEEAVQLFQRVLELKPDYHEALLNLGVTTGDQGDLEKAAQYFRRGLEVNPGEPAWRLRAELMLPVIADSLAVIDDKRALFGRVLEDFRTSGVSLEPPLKFGTTFFYLSYHDADNRSLLELGRDTYRTCAPSLNLDVPHLASDSGPQNRIHVGFVSQFLCAHTIGKLNRGFIQKLDRTRFHVTVLHAPKSKRDRIREEIDLLADQVVELPSDISLARQKIADLRLDVLHYPDIGMSPFTYFLAFARLAAVQSVSWGHPDTSGLDSMDYYLSPDVSEPAGAEAYYTETLIRMARFPAYYEPLIAPALVTSRSDFGLPEDAHLYGCPQSLFKIHPDFDAVLAEIVERDPHARIVLLEGKPQWKDRLQARWARVCPALLTRVIWLPRQSLEGFMQLLAHMDVLLDPIHFGSGNTLYESLVYGQPYVTFPGRFMRGRLVAGMYQLLEIADAPVALCLEDYARTAVEWAGDPDRRKRLRDALLARTSRLFCDESAVTEFESFIIDAVAAAAEGKKLDSSWRWKGKQ